MGSPGIGQFDTDCGGGVFANGNTSCAFAQVVHDNWLSEAGGSSALIVATSPVTGQTYTMACVRSGNSVTCIGGNEAAVWFQVESSGPGGEFVNDCGGVWANSNTSCPFAQNVHQQWLLDNPKGAAGGASGGTIDVYSPVTNQTYTMTWVRAPDSVTCRGGDDAAVWFAV